MSLDVPRGAKNPGKMHNVEKPPASREHARAVQEVELDVGTTTAKTANKSTVAELQAGIESLKRQLEAASTSSESMDDTPSKDDKPEENVDDLDVKNPGKMHNVEKPPASREHARAVQEVERGQEPRCADWFPRRKIVK